ncbi:MAG: LL-diaminopimelate aminotransferase [Clostridiales bacterium]|nr:LL-diaminopimelate aminotransferase [Clostridiales bacterium]
MLFNPYFADLSNVYLFAEAENRLRAFLARTKPNNVIKMGIGDVTQPLCAAAVEAGKTAVEEMGKAESFRGYGPYRGYPFLIKSIAAYYKSRGISLDEDEIFISDGSKSDVAGFTDLFAKDNTVLLQDPVYPVYADANILHGRKIVYASATMENGFLPLPDERVKADIIYLCSPNNPTGAVYSAADLEQWVAYAKSMGAVILFDAAYEAFVTEDKKVRSIYEVRGADEVAVEFCSFSKTAGFTGVRCGYTVVPKKLANLNALWFRRQSAKSNGVSYVTQRMAEAALTNEGQKQTAAAREVYRKNAQVILQALRKTGVFHTGGVNAPYIWFKCGGSSWDFFDRLLNEVQVVGTPGVGFGRNGEGFFRLTAFNTYKNTVEAMRRIQSVLRA